MRWKINDLIMKHLETKCRVQYMLDVAMEGVHAL